MAVKTKPSFVNEIKCPGCGWGYDIDEIFFFDDLKEKPSVETFICESCGKHLIIEAMVKFSTTIDEKLEQAYNNTYEIEEKTELCIEDTLLN